VELFIEAVSSLDKQYIDSYVRAEERHAERYAASKGKRAGKGKTAGKKVAVKSEEAEFDLPSSKRAATSNAPTRRSSRAVSSHTSGASTQVSSSQLDDQDPGLSKYAESPEEDEGGSDRSRSREAVRSSRSP
jgi:hypothetical protein